MTMIILIPAFEPNATLVTLVRDLRQTAPWMGILVVDDGSGPAFEPIFREVQDAGAEVIGTRDNHGKGHALKLGFRHVLATSPGTDVVTADSDGQHAVADIVRIASRVEEGDGALVLGGRRFAGDVPLRSRFGNTVSRRLFRLSTGVDIHDTQTGLRGIPADLVEHMLEIPGERFEYEQSMLVDLCRQIDEVEIETIYLEKNASSHFRPVLDSIRVLLPVLRFGLVSFGSFLIDTVMLQVLFWVSGSLGLSVFGARLVSASTNFLANRRFVFGATGDTRRRVIRYLMLAGGLLAASYLALQSLTGLGVPLLAAKVISEGGLYVVSFLVQKTFVFGQGRTRRRRTASTTASATTSSASTMPAITNGMGERVGSTTGATGTGVSVGAAVGCTSIATAHSGSVPIVNETGSNSVPAS
jgi:putative flippase GtrA